MTPTQTSFFLNEQNPWKITSNLCIKFDPSQQWVPEKMDPWLIPGLPVTALMYGPSKIHQAVFRSNAKAPRKGEKAEEDGGQRRSLVCRSVGFFLVGEFNPLEKH